MIGPAHGPGVYGEFEELRDFVIEAVAEAARREADVDPHGLDVTEEDLARFELHRLRMWYRLAAAAGTQSRDAVHRASLFGASGADVANAAGMAGFSQARRLWPQLDVLDKAREWLTQHRGEIEAATAALVPVADRLGPQVQGPELGPTARERAAHLTAKVTKADIVQLRTLVMVDILAWLRDSQPQQHDTEAQEVLRVLEDLAERARPLMIGPFLGA